MPEPDVRAVCGAVDGGHGFQEALGDGVERCISVGEAEQVAVREGCEFIRAVADALVLRQERPAVLAAFGDPLGIADLLGVVGVEVGDEMDGVSGVPQSVCRDLPRLRSKKNSSGLSEDVLDDVLGKAVLLGDGSDRLARAPERDDVLDLHLVPGQHGGAPAESGVDDDLGACWVVG